MGKPVKFRSGAERKAHHADRVVRRFVDPWGSQRFLCESVPECYRIKPIHSFKNDSHKNDSKNYEKVKQKYAHFLG